MKTIPCRFIYDPGRERASWVLRNSRRKKTPTADRLNHNARLRFRCFYCRDLGCEFEREPLLFEELHLLDRRAETQAHSARPVPDLDFLRRRTSGRADSMQELDDIIADTVAGESPNPMDTTLASEQARALHDCLAQLEHKQREVVSLAYLRDLSHGELAEQLKLPLGTVKTWIRRGLEQLRGCMARFA